MVGEDVGFHRPGFEVDDPDSEGCEFETEVVREGRDGGFGGVVDG